MAKTPQQWRSEWARLKVLISIGVMRGFPVKGVTKQRVANCVLGYAMARGWHNV